MVKFSADQVYALLSRHLLTDEQRAVVEGAPIDAPALVIAGAGSGKTELMTVRVLYLVANSLAKPSEILGLTFTRKAASELSARINQALYKLRETELWPNDLELDFAPATITTYNSFGNDIFRRLSLTIGFEQDATLISEAGAISLADELLKNAGSDLTADLDQWEKTKGHLIDLVLQLNAEMTDNQAGSEKMKAYLDRFIEKVTALPQTESGSMERYSYTNELLAVARQNQMLADLANSYQELKASRNLVDFSDQVALALRALDQPLHHGYKFVLLDEYQDTSSIQTQLLSKLFAGSSVLAVGDPNQAIYGWRGASSNNLVDFHQDFLSPGPVTFTLSRSWRSGPSVVAAANRLTGLLNASQPQLAPVSLEPGKPDTKDHVAAQILQDETQEAQAIAIWLAERLTENKSAALLVRTKASMRMLAEALEAKGLAVEITGLSSLMEMPEVVDLISALNVLNRPESGAHLMRLLAGPKWRIGPKDIAELSNFAKKLGYLKKSPSSMPLTIIEALDELRFDSNHKHAEFSEVGLRRLVQAAEFFAAARGRSSLTLTELCWAVVRELEIDIELFAHSQAPNPLGNLEAFIAKVADFEQSSLRPSATSLLAWLDQAKDKENFELPKSGAKNGVVQIMSVHAAKGLEWDLVAVAGLNQGSFPIESRGAKGWLSPGKLPFELRGDASVLPVLDFSNATTQRSLKKLFDEFQDSNRERALLEERRLAYVAVTRAREELLLTSSHYKQSAKKPRPISPFLQELIDDELCEISSNIPTPLESNPLDGVVRTAIWPVDPLGENRNKLEAAASTVRSHSPVGLEDFTELTLLLEERERVSWVQSPRLPARISASKLLRLLAEPEQFADWLLRPMPQLYSESATLGTSFHAKLEEAFLSGLENPIESWAQEESELGANFENSRFAKLVPEFVEQAIEFELGGLIVVCKIDAIFQTEFGYEVVDWKSGASPKDPADLERRALQLALYRIAFSKWAEVPLERIKASFFFAKDGVDVSPDNLWSEGQFVEEISRVRTARRG
jgi:DNA helicase-2/ATP-dependent DNA helicase PcrA